MAANDDFMRQLLATFAAEAREHLQVINRDLLLLEQHSGTPATESSMAGIFRAAHSLKGAARAVGVEPIGLLAHRLETIFGRVRSGDLQPLPEQFDLIYRAVDMIGACVETLGSGTGLTADVTELADELEGIDDLPPRRPVDDITGNGMPVPSLVLNASSTVDPAEIAIPSESSGSTTVALEGGAQPVSQRLAGAAVPADGTVRVSTSKLDAIMEQVGELQVARLNAAQHERKLRGLLEEAERWEANWRALYPRQHVEAAKTAWQAAPDSSRGVAQEIAPRVIASWEDSQERLSQLVRQLRDLSRWLESDRRRTAQIVDDLEENVRHTRMMPVGAVFETFPRMVRDLARDLGKQVRLVIHGGETEVDRSVLELIKDPLTHLLRNAIDHGIEAPAQRTASNKPAEGVMELRAAQRGDSILIEVSDDGAGIDPARIRAGALERGFLRADEAAAMSEHESLWLIFRSGISTRAQVTELSGRGVGLDVVREHIERLHGLIDVESNVGRGTRFQLHLPLTVATTLCLLAQVGDKLYSLPASGVVRILRVRLGDICHAEGREVIRVDGRPVALAHLDEILEISRSVQPVAEHRSLHRPDLESSDQYAIILGAAEKRVAFLADAVVDVQEMVIKSLPRPYMRLRHVAGAAILGTGEVVIVLSIADLLRSAGQRVAHALRDNERPEGNSTTEEGLPGILVVDDSFTTRTLEKNILETAGYRVQVASDGLEAWTLLQNEASDLMVSDVMMPRMDGFELTARVRGDARFKHLPIILVTAQESREDRERGIQVGADAYILKSAFDQESLLNTIRRFI